MSGAWWRFDVAAGAGVRVCVYVCVEGSGHQVMLALNQTARGGFGLKQSLLESAI